MKLFTNLPRTLRVIFGSFRILTVVLIVLGICGFLFLFWAKKQSSDDPKLIVNMGEVFLKIDHSPTPPSAEIDQTMAVQLDKLRGHLQMDILTEDANMGSALRWTILPLLSLFFIYQWFILGAIRNICWHIEKGEIFSERNFRDVKNIGLMMIGYGLVVGLDRTGDSTRGIRTKASAPGPCPLSLAGDGPVPRVRRFPARKGRKGDSRPPCGRPMLATDPAGRRLTYPLERR